MRQVHAKITVTGFEYRQIDSHVGLRPGMRLNIDVFRAEKFFRARDRQRLDFVDKFTAAVISFARIAFGVLVGHHAALGLQHGLAHNVFRGDQLQVLFKPAGFFLNGRKNFGIDLF
jgi:hypothetical protein